MRGRAFTEDEVSNQDAGPRPAILSAIDGTQPLARRRPDRPNAAVGDPGLQVVNTLQVVGVAADAQLTALGQIDPYYVYVPGEGGAVLGQGPHRRR